MLAKYYLILKKEHYLQAKRRGDKSWKPLGIPRLMENPESTKNYVYHRTYAVTAVSSGNPKSCLKFLTHILEFGLQRYPGSFGAQLQIYEETQRGNGAEEGIAN